VFYLLTIAAVFRLRMRNLPRRGLTRFRISVIPALYLVSAAAILIVLFIYRPATTFPGMVIVVIGVPVYYAFRWSSGKAAAQKKPFRP